MENFKRNNKFRGKRDFGRHGSDRSDRPAMHKAICSNCGKACEVPFRPTGSKPVLCRDCFRGNEGSSPRRFDRNDVRRSNSEDRQMYNAVCDSCGDHCKVPFQPTSGKPIYCSNCFEKNQHADSRRPDSRRSEDRNSEPQYSKQFAELNTKLDQILNMLTPEQKIPIEIETPPMQEAAETKKTKTVKKTTSKTKKK